MGPGNRGAAYTVHVYVYDTAIPSWPYLASLSLLANRDTLCDQTGYTAKESLWVRVFLVLLASLRPSNSGHRFELSSGGRRNLANHFAASLGSHSRQPYLPSLETVTPPCIYAIALKRVQLRQFPHTKLDWAVTTPEHLVGVDI